MSCIFCDIIAGEAPAVFLAEWRDTVAFVPLGPVADGHALIVPKRHVANAIENPHETSRTMRRAAEYAAQFEFSNIVTSIGQPATQSIFHLHIHVVPRHKNDKLMLPWGTMYGEDPQAPHWCRVADDLQRQLLATAAS